MTYAAQWFRAFVFTLAVELPIAVFLLRRIEPSYLRRSVAALVGNLATHPVVWFALPTLALAPLQLTCLQEGWAVGIEAITYRLVFSDLRWSGAIGISAVANGSSFALGLVLRAAHFPI